MYPGLLAYLWLLAYCMLAYLAVYIALVSWKVKGDGFPSIGPRSLCIHLLRQLWSLDIATFVIPHTYTRLGDRAFPVAGPRLWNSLPSNLRQSDLTFQQFRRALKTYLFGWLETSDYVCSVLYKCSCLLLVHTRQRLRSASSSDPMVPRTIHSTIGERSFQSAAASTWNALSRSVRSSTTVFQFRSRLKTERFARSYQQSYWICLCVNVKAQYSLTVLKVPLNSNQSISASLWLNIFVPRSWSLWIYVTLMTILILTN